MEYFVFPVIFLAGILTKLADLMVDDGLKIWAGFAYVTGIAYGILTAYIITAYPLLSPLGLALALAVLLTKKIDRKPHNIGIAAMILSFAFWGFPRVDIVLLAVFLASGVIDEIGNDLSDRGRIKGIAGKIFGRRAATDVAAFLVSLATGYWIIFFGILSFDAGYLLAEVSGKRFK